MRTWLDTYLAGAAAAELASREKYYPGDIEAARIERGDAAADLDAWRAIAALFDGGEVETECSWAQLELATSRALIALSEKAEAKPTLAERRDAVHSIHARIAWHRWYHSRPRAPRPNLAAIPTRQVAQAA